MTTNNIRVADHAIDPVFLARWSPRAFSPEEISLADLMSMLEAARWAPSSFNAQPWRFVYARRGTPHWETCLDLLVPANREWAKTAAALIFLASKTTVLTRGSEIAVPSATHAFDAGAASACMALQASMMGWHMHGMAGFDRVRANVALNVPPDHVVHAVYAVGRAGDPSSLPEPLRAREYPSLRTPLAEVAFDGGFPERRAV